MKTTKLYIAAILFVLLAFATIAITTKMTIFAVPDNSYGQKFYYYGVTTGEQYVLSGHSPMNFRIDFQDSSGRDIYVKLQALNRDENQGWFSINKEYGRVFTTSSGFTLRFDDMEYSNVKIRPVSYDGITSANYIVSLSGTSSVPTMVHSTTLPWEYAIVDNGCVPGTWKCIDSTERWQCKDEGVFEHLYDCSSGLTCSYSGGTKCEDDEGQEITCYRCKTNGYLESSIFIVYDSNLECPLGWYIDQPSCTQEECYKWVDCVLEIKKEDTCSSGWTTVYEIRGNEKIKVGNIPDEPSECETPEPMTCYKCVNEELTEFTHTGTDCPAGSFTEPPATCKNKSDVPFCGDKIIETGEVCDGETAIYFCSDDCRTKTLKDIDDTEDPLAILMILLLGGSGLILLILVIGAFLLLIAVGSLYLYMKRRKK